MNRQQLLSFLEDGQRHGAFTILDRGPIDKVLEDYNDQSLSHDLIGLLSLHRVIGL